MGLSWSSFFLEIINFLVLVWVLKRLFYAPVAKVIEERRQAIQKTLDDARAMEMRAEERKRAYEERLKEREEEKQKAMEALCHEIDEERCRRMKTLEAMLAEERLKREAIEKTRSAQAFHRMEIEALRSSSRFASRLLEKLAGPELEGRILSLFAETPCNEETESLLPREDGEAWVKTAYELTNEQKELITRTLTRMQKKPVHCRFERVPELIAGLRIQIGAFVLEADLKDELKYFALAGGEGG